MGHDVLAVLAARRARRAISPEPISREALLSLIDAASLAPSCYNKQPWRFIAATGGTELEELRASLSKGNEWALKAPALVAALTKPSLDCRLDEGRDYALFDTGLAVMSLLIQAQSQGLVAHPMAGFDPKAARKALRVPPDYVIICVIAVGKPGAASGLDERQKAMEAAPRSRKPMGSVYAIGAFREEWEAE